jgi:cytochrome P450
LIPDGTGITITPYVIHRDSRYFSPRPDEFWPERWFISSSKEGEEFVLDRAAYIPFSYGPGNCVGKSLALLELRYVIAMLVRRFDFVFEKGWFEDDTVVVKKGLNSGAGGAGVRDEFALSPGALRVVVSVRRE